VLECQCADYNGNYQSTSIGLSKIPLPNWSSLNIF